MATLIQSKQIQGVVTASVIEGDFQVDSGSVNLSGASGVSGSFSGSYVGDGSGLTFKGTGIVSGSTQITDGSGIVSSSAQVISHLPDGTVSGSSQITDGSGIVSGSQQISITQTDGFTSFSSSIATSIGNIVDTDTDDQTLSFNQASKELTISEGNTVDLSSLGGGGGGGGSSIWTTEGGKYKVSADLDVTGSITATSFTGSIDYSNLTNKPSGIVSGSVLRNLDGTGAFSGSLVAGTNITINQDGDNFIISSSASGGSVPAGTISSSAQLTTEFDTRYLNTEGDGIVSGSVLRTLDGTGVLSGSKTDITSLNSYTSSTDSRLSSIEAATGSYLTSETDSQTLSIDGNELTISTGNTITLPSGGGGSVPAGTISGSAQITAFGFTSGSHTDIPSGTISSSAQVISSLPSGVLSGSSQITDGSGILSGSITSQLPSGLVSGSYSSSVDSRILTEKSRIDNILSGANADYDQFVEIVDLVNSTDTTNDTAFANHYTSSRQRDTALELFTSSIDTTIKSKLNTDNVLSGSITTLLPSGVISGSVQITDGSGIVSGSVIRTFDETGIFSGSLVAGTNITINQVGDNFEISSSASGGSASVTVSDSAPGSPSEGDLWWKSNDGNLYIYYDGYWVISTDISTGLPAGVVSGSTQITSIITDSYISASAASSGFGSGGGTSDFTQLTNVPSGLVSSSTQVTDGSGIVSGSVLTTLGGTDVVSGSVLRNLDGTNVVSGSVLRNLDGTDVVSGSVLRNLGGTNVISGSSQITALGFISESFSTDGTNIVSGSVLRNLDGTGVFSGSSQITDGSGIVSSSAQLTYNGNRVVSNTDLPSGVYNNNFGTSGSIEDFITKVFFPNTTPTITTGNQTIEEYTSNGSTIVTIAGTDPEGQSLTFGTASSYSDDLVRVASNGVLTLNALAESSSFNTDLVGGVHGHTFTATATDTFNATIEKDITIFVTPNEAPKFREGSTGGNIITSVTSNLNENSPNDTLVKRVFFTDTEGDSITITSSSIDNDHFDITKYSTYVDIRQNTSSLDYESQTQYTFSITASDEHYESGEDSDSRTFLPITINVTDNLVPTLSNQTLSSINENSSNGASVGSISATDNEGDSISFVTFDLHKLELDNSNVASGSYGGTSQLTDPHENPFQMDSSGNVTRKTGVVINSDLINEYQYRVQVRDNFNSTISSVAIVTIPISDDTAATITDNWSAGPYIKESELSGTTIKTTDYGSTQADYGSNQSGTWSSSNSAISINSNGSLSLNVNLSGSVTQSGDTIDSTITFTNGFGTTTTDSLTVNVIENDAPTATFTNQTSNLNANLATENTNLVLVGISDTESDTPYSASLSGTDASKLNLDYQNSNSSSVYIRANEDLSAGTLTYNIKVTDNYDKSTTYSNQTITIATPDGGTLGGDTTSYIIESGENGESIRDASGFGAGNQSQMSVSYSPNYGSQAVQGSSWSSSNPAISINTSGQLSLALDISGSTTGSGDDIVSTIGFQDQYGNAGSGTVTVNVFANQAPTATFTNQTSNFETDLATTGTTMVSMSISDTESDTPFSASLSGTDASSLQLVYTNANSSSVGIQATGNLSAATYNYNVRVTDNFGKSRDYNSRSFTVDTSADNGKVYLYDVGFSNATYNTAVGISSEDSSTPPIPTPYSNIGFVDAVINDDVIGDSTFTYSYGSTQTATKLGEASGSNLHDVLRSMGSSGTISRNSSKHFVILFPSGSDMGGIPTSTTDGYGGSTTGEYVLEVGTDGTTIDGTNTIEASEINQMTLGTSHVGYTKWFMVGAANQVASSTSINLGLSPSSGSGGV